MKSLVDNNSWIISNCWLACFDILGFKEWVSIKSNRGNSEAIAAYKKDVKNKEDKDIIKDYVKIREVLSVYDKIQKEYLKNSCNRGYDAGLDYCWFSDTFLMFTRDYSEESYSAIQFAAKQFIEECLNKVPMRGTVQLVCSYELQTNGYLWERDLSKHLNMQ